MSLQPGVGYTFTSSSLGTNLNVETPWAVWDASPYGPLTPTLIGNKVGATPGTINRYIPQIGSTYIDAATRPTITIEGPGFICAKCTYEAGKFFPRTATIVYHPGATPPADTNTESFYPLAKVNEKTTGEVTTYFLTLLVQPANLAVNRLKAGANTATWWWTRV